MTLVALIVCLDTTKGRHYCLGSDVLWDPTFKILRCRYKKKNDIWQIGNVFFSDITALEAPEKLNLPLNGTHPLSLKYPYGSLHNTLQSSWLLWTLTNRRKNSINVNGLQILIAPDTGSLLTWTKMLMPSEQNKEIDYEVSFFSTSSWLWVINGAGSLISFCLDLG